MITENEKKVLRFLLVNFASDYSINEIAKQCSIAPNGAFEILKKYEKAGIVIFKKIANVKSYQINFNSREALVLLELILIPDYNEARIHYRYQDLKPLETKSNLCIIFGSYAEKKAKPNDIDVLFVIKKKDFQEYNQLLDKIRLTVPLKIHDVIQTREDLTKNLKGRDKIMMEMLTKGIIIWGQDFLIEVIKDVAQGKTE